MNLYKVTLKGMTYDSGSGVIYGESYVVADDAEKAYKIVKCELSEKDIGTYKDRALDKVELIAEQKEYPDCQIRLYLQEDSDAKTAQE